MIQMNLFTKQKQTDLENELIVMGGKTGGRDSYGVCDGRVHLLYFKWITNKDLLYSKGNSTLKVMWQLGWEGRLGENGYMYIYG